jgi:Predicted membrane protein
LRWQGERPGDGAFKLTTRFSGLRVAASAAHPGFENVSGVVRGDERSGNVEINSSALALDLPMIFREAQVPLDRLLARGTWKRTAHGVRFNLDQMDFANADAAGTAHGSYDWQRGHAGISDLSAHLTRGNATAIYRYLPLAVGERTLGWVKRALVSGTSDDTTLTLKGNLDHFPFENDVGGVFKVAIQAHDVVLDYVEGWPRIDRINALVVFHGKRMEVDADQGYIYSAQLGPVKAVIPDLSVSDELLELGGNAIGPTRDFIRFANFSPVGVTLDGLTDRMDGDGNLALALNLKIPLQHSADTTLGGRLSFLGGSLAPPGLPRLHQTRGDIVFTERTVRSQGLAANFLGGPIAINASTQGGHALIRAAGRATAKGLAPWLGAAWNARLAGDTAWRGQLVLNGAQSEVRIESDLVGLESRLPAPLDKPAARPLPLLVTRQPQADGAQQFAVQLGQTVGAVWQTSADDHIERGEIRFGGAATMPQEPGLRLAGNGRGLALSDWMQMLPVAQDNSGLPISTVDLSFGTLDLMGRRFPDVRVQGRNRGACCAWRSADAT